MGDGNGEVGEPSSVRLELMLNGDDVIDDTPDEVSVDGELLRVEEGTGMRGR